MPTIFQHVSKLNVGGILRKWTKKGSFYTLIVEKQVEKEMSALEFLHNIARFRKTLR